MRLHLFFLLVLSTIVACSQSSVEPATDQLATASGATGVPMGFKACREAEMSSYLDICTVNADCTGMTSCDLRHEFAAASRCRAPQCEDASDCDRYVSLCSGDDFHFECRATSARVPKECRFVEGPAPAK